VLGTGFSLGFLLALASPLRAEARPMAASVEGAVILPALFLAGARMVPVEGPVFWIAGAAVLARIATSVLAAGLVAAIDPRVRRAGPAFALAFLSTGPLGIAVALAVNLRYPGVLGDVVLAASVASAVAGEFLGPPALRRALRRAGEVPA
jgi:hypothetical protein